VGSLVVVETEVVGERGLRLPAILIRFEIHLLGNSGDTTLNCPLRPESARIELSSNHRLRAIPSPPLPSSVYQRTPIHTGTGFRGEGQYYLIHKHKTRVSYSGQ